jgi:arsenical pump membrane protein
VPRALAGTIALLLLAATLAFAVARPRGPPKALVAVPAAVLCVVLANLLAFRASGLSFARFGALMALPWLAAIAVE